MFQLDPDPRQGSVQRGSAHHRARRIVDRGRVVFGHYAPVRAVTTFVAVPFGIADSFHRGRFERHRQQLGKSAPAGIWAYRSKALLGDRNLSATLLLVWGAAAHAEQL